MGQNLIVGNARGFMRNQIKLSSETTPRLFLAKSFSDKQDMGLLKDVFLLLFLLAKW